ncbi:MAG: FimV/HubP family polar landmark protein [Thalassotalea sp.]|nr:FimV/HubP family polar landmark protein [Thalassotalea sp.]
MASNKTSIKILSTCASLLLSSTVLLSSQLHAQEQTSQLNGSKSPAITAVFVDDNKNSYGPILKSDTLWKIAVAHRPDETVTNFQVMMALFASNPNAFLRNDINTLVEGQYLRIPSLEEIRTIAPYAYGDNNKTSLEIAANDIANGTATTTVSTNDVAGTDKDITEVATPVDKPATVETPAEPINSQVAAQETATNPVTAQPVIAANAVESTSSQSELNIAEENKELKESLTAVDDQLSYLQYEVAKASEKQSEMDALIAEQKQLLTESKKREKRLLAQQQALVKQREGLFNNPISYWSTTGVLAVLVIVLFVLVYRRRSIEQLAGQNQQPQPSADPKPIKKPANKANESVAKQTENNKADSANTTSVDSNKAANQESIDSNDTDLTLFAIENESSIFTSTETGTESVKVDDSKTKPENEHVETAFSKIDLTNAHDHSDELLTDEGLLNSLVTDAPLKKQPSINEIEIEIANDDELDIDQIINGMLDEDTKPAKLRSSITGNAKQDFTNNGYAKQESAKVNEINDYDDVEFDKLLEEISAQTNDVVISPASNVVKIQPLAETEQKIAPQTSQISQAEQDYIAIEQLIEDSEEEAVTVEDEIYDGEKIDVGLDEFPEFTKDVKHVDVDDDKNGVNAKLDLAQVYIEIGDLDNAAVILKSVMKLGSSSQQQQAQTLLYSLHD